MASTEGTGDTEVLKEVHFCDGTGATHGRSFGFGVNAPDYRGGIQRLDYGGGEIRFNGKFLLPELKALN